MAETVRVRPQAGMQCRHPVTKHLIPETGLPVDPADLDIDRCLRHGDLVVMTAKEIAAVETAEAQAIIDAQAAKDAAAKAAQPKTAKQPPV